MTPLELVINDGTPPISRQREMIEAQQRLIESLNERIGALERCERALKRKYIKERRAAQVATLYRGASA